MARSRRSRSRATCRRPRRPSGASSLSSPRLRPPPGNAVVTTGDEAGEARYRENDLNNAGDTTNRRELRVRGEDMIVVDQEVAFCSGVPPICTIALSKTHPAADGDLFKVYIT